MMTILGIISWSIYCGYVVYFTKEAAEKACEILNREKFMMENNI